MFEQDYTFYGKHATLLKYLDAKVYSRYIDVYMNAAVMGLLHGKRSVRDSSEDRARIYADAFARERENCIFLYRLVMLLDESTKLTPEQRIDRAFRDDARYDSTKLQENLDIFHSYILGGIELLYDKYTTGCTTSEDYIDRIYELMSSFKDEISANVSYEDKLSALMNSGGR